MDRRVPTEAPTYRESMEATYELMRQAAQAEATALEKMDRALDESRAAGLEPLGLNDPERSRKYFRGKVPPQLLPVAKKVGDADREFQRAHAERKHWEGYWRRYADMLDAQPELADQPLRKVGWVRKVAGRAA